MEFLWFILIGLAAGYLAGLIIKGGGMGLIWNLITGVLGAVIGGRLLSLFNVHFGGLVGQLITAVIGAVVLLWIVTLVQKKK